MLGEFHNASLRTATIISNRKLTVIGSDGTGQLQQLSNEGTGQTLDDAVALDMNGDGLMDPVYLSPSTLTYWLNLGWGQWGPEVIISDLPFVEAEMDSVELEDLNNDGIVNAADALLASQHVVGRTIANPSFDLTRCNVIGVSDGGESE